MDDEGNPVQDFDCDDYVSDWTEWEGVNFDLLFNKGPESTLFL